MDITVILFGWFPIALCLVLMIWSIHLTRVKVKPWKVILTFFVLIALVFSVFILIAMINGAWPTYIPYIIMIFVAVILTIQQLWAESPPSS